MSVLYTKTFRSLREICAAILLVAVLLGVFPTAAFADTEPPENGGESSVTVDADTGTSTEEMNDDGDTGTSTAAATDNGSEEDGEQGTDGEDTPAATTTATTTDTGTGTSTPGTDGTEGPDGGDGDAGTGVEETGEDEGEPVPIFSESDIGTDATPDDGESVTGDIFRTGRNVHIVTGEAVAQGQIATDVNNNLVRSEIEIVPSDLDVYSFSATGTNEANIANDGGAFAQTGDNVALSTGVAEITTGNAVAAFNIANVVNSNVINSDGFLYLKNQVLTPGQSLDLTDFFFPEQGSLLAGANDCSLLSCMAEDIVYNFSQSNTAHIVNDAYVKAITGDNFVDGDFVEIETGDAYGGANVINVVNTNIIDSNYRFLTLNAVGDLDGDLVLPTEQLFKAFFGKPNGVSQATLQRENVDINVENVNEALINNNVETYAETGLNLDQTSFDASIVTGRGESESNIFNKVNENVYGGDSFYLLIRVHGAWDGDVYGLPEGLTWMWTSDGVLIYNEGAEIELSEILPYDIDSYEAQITDHNDVIIDNNINIDAITGRNEMEGIAGNVRTGNAFASANVMNIANTNIVGTNFSVAVINIFGDFDGDVSFSASDLSVTGSVVAQNNPATPGTALTYTYVVENVSDKTATGITLRQTLQNAYTSGTNNQQIVTVGTLAPGQTKTVTLTASVRNDLTYGNHTVVATATVDSNEADGDISNNTSLLQVAVAYPDPGNGTDTGTTTGNGTPTTTDDGTPTTTDDGTPTTTDNGTGDPGTGDDDTDQGTENPGDTTVQSKPTGGGGPSSKSNTTTKKIEREEMLVDPTKPPHLLIEKTADVPEKKAVTAGQEVDYTITVTNYGGNAYDAEVFDILTNPIGSVVTEQSWELGTILPGEVITLTYTTAYAQNTPTGEYKNTARVEAYKNEDDKEKGVKPLTVDDAVYTLTIQGVDLAVGNIGVLAFFPGANGLTSALVVWETSKSATSQMFYGPKGTTFNKDAFNYGYPFSSFVFEEPKERHAMIVMGLTPGTTYSYRIDAHSGKYDAVSREYEIFVPFGVGRLTLNLPTGYYPALAPTPYYAQGTTPVGTVAGASTYKAPVAPKPVTPTPAPSAPEPVEESESTPPQEEAGFFGKAKNTFFGLFR